MLKYNPFKPGSIIHTGMFAGRIEELRTIEKAIFQTSKGNPGHFLIHGERGIGKSSLMMVANGYATGNLETLGNNKYDFLTVSIELEPHDEYRDIILKVARQLQRELDQDEALKATLREVWNFITNWEILGVKYNRETTPTDAMLEELSERLIRISKSLPSKQGIFIFIDEADKPSIKAGLGEFVKVLTERLSKKGALNIGLGIVGITDVIKKMRSSHESSVRILTPISLEPLLSDERKEVIYRGLNEAEKENGVRTEIDAEALNLISDYSEGYPHFIQQYAYSAFDEDNDNVISVRDAVYGLTKDDGALQMLGKRYFESMYTAEVRSDDYRKVLQVVAQHSPHYVQRKKIIEESGLKQHTVDNAINALKKRGTLVPRRGQSGQYRLPSHSFAAWIRAFKITPTRKED